MRATSLSPVASLPRVSINVFTRVPEPGRVKTRLVPAIGGQRAADLLRSMARFTLARVREVDIGPATLWCTPAPDETLRTLAEEFGTKIRVQNGVDLGERMHYALRRALDEHAAALVLGTDCPFVSREDLERARTLLFEHDHRVVLGPAFDGGYYLLAARVIDTSLFTDIPWGSAEVLGRTRRRLDAMGWRFAELDFRHDIDRPEDLLRLRDIPELAHFAVQGLADPAPGARPAARNLGHGNPSPSIRKRKIPIKQ